LDQNVDTDYFIKKDQIFAKSSKKGYTASQDCYLLMPDKNPSPKDHDAGFLVTKRIVKYENI
jgi:hypothetical protein